MRTWESLSPVEQELLSDAMQDDYSFAEGFSIVTAAMPDAREGEAAAVFRTILRSFFYAGWIRLIHMDTEANLSDMTPEEATAVMSDDANFAAATLRESHYKRYLTTDAGDRVGSRTPV